MALDPRERFGRSRKRNQSCASLVQAWSDLAVHVSQWLRAIQSEKRMSRAHSTVRYASRVTGVDFEKYLVWGGIAAAIYFVVWPVLKSAIAVKGAVDAGINTARDALSSGLYRVFGPEEKFGPELTYTVRFPDGNHSLDPAIVAADGTFSRNGKRYRLLIDKRIVSGINKTAFPL
jgi:hypothetical protein